MLQDAITRHVVVSANNRFVSRIYREYSDACLERSAAKHGEKDRLSEPG